MLNVLLTRHGYTSAGEVVLGGTIDVPLARRGRDEAELLSRRLAGVRIDRIISSPMVRACETAAIIAAGRPIETDERLREMHYGRWEGMTFEGIPKQDPELRARWESDPAETHTPGGESGEEVAARVLSFLADLIETEGISGSMAAEAVPAHAAMEDRNVLVVAHGTLNRILLCLAMGVPVRDYRRRFVQDRGNLTVLRYERGDTADGAQLILSNDIAHLRKPGEVPWA
jgi:broad specificity phosphatase PhoE